MDSFATLVALLGLVLLAWDCVEVGRNDAANIVNAVFGSRILKRRTASLLAGAAVVLGATAATPVMETARKGIFDPGLMTLDQAMTVYISIYLVHTVLLYSYSAFGMPVSTTACLVFALVGAAVGLYGPSVVYWRSVGTVVSAIVVSIVTAGLAGFMVQRVFRAAVRDQAEDRQTILLHGPWMAGLMLTWLSWFMLLKGLEGVGFVETIRAHTIETFGMWLALLGMWAGYTLVVHLVLTFSGHVGTRHLFRATALIGMLCMAFAFGQNDLANAASPGVSAFTLWYHADKTVATATQIAIPIWGLLLCGLFIAAGMSTRHAQRVTRAEVNTGSQFDRVALYAPRWCQALARWIARPAPTPESPVELAPPPALTPTGQEGALRRPARIGDSVGQRQRNRVRLGAWPAGLDHVRRLRGRHRDRLGRSGHGPGRRAPEDRPRHLGGDQLVPLRADRHGRHGHHRHRRLSRTRGGNRRGAGLESRRALRRQAPQRRARAANSRADGIARHRRRGRRRGTPDRRAGAGIAPESRGANDGAAGRLGARQGAGGGPHAIRSGSRRRSALARHQPSKSAKRGANVIAPTVTAVAAASSTAALPMSSALRMAGS